MKSFLKISLIYIFIFELIFQLLIFFDFKFIKIPDLFYNGYCDQKYWNFNNKKTIFKTETKYHPILSFVKTDVVIPEKIQNDVVTNTNGIMNNTVSLYGSSYINHDEFKTHLSKKENINFNNYALNSYGLDQIYLSYMLTSHLNQNRVIVIGFLLEDLDRSVFYKREYQKLFFSIEKGKFELKNIPVNLNVETKKNRDFYFFRFVNNFYNLSKNKFDPRMDKCLIHNKKKLFNYFFENIKKEAEKLNQKIIVITFNLQEDITNKSSWRYKFVKNYFIENNIEHVDALDIMNKKLDEHNEKIEEYFGKDRHNNKKSYEYILSEFYKIYKAM